MRTNSLKEAVTATQEDYLRTIYLLIQRDEDVSVTNIAEHLKLSKSTVSERLKELVSAQLVSQAHYGKVSLTTKGEQIGKKVTHKHRLLEVFLHQTLGMSDADIHAEADILEHALSDTVARRLGTFLGKPAHDPHGSDIPPLD